MQKEQDLCLELQKLPRGIREQGSPLPLLLLGSHPISLSTQEIPISPHPWVLFQILGLPRHRASPQPPPSIPKPCRAAPAPLRAASNHNKTQGKPAFMSLDFHKPLRAQVQTTKHPKTRWPKSPQAGGFQPCTDNSLFSKVTATFLFHISLFFSLSEKEGIPKRCSLLGAVRRFRNLSRNHRCF